MKQRLTRQVGYVALAKRIKLPESSKRVKTWTGNDSENRHHHDRVNLAASPLIIHLSWKEHDKAVPQFVGCYELNLDELLKHDLVRRDQPGKIRLRFFHDSDGVIYIQHQGSTARLAIGEFHKG